MAYDTFYAKETRMYLLGDDRILLELFLEVRVLCNEFE
jgi:hypothetical protein